VAQVVQGFLSKYKTLSNPRTVENKQNKKILSSLLRLDTIFQSNCAEKS
jgi:hypothetical protein